MTRRWPHVVPLLLVLAMPRVASGQEATAPEPEQPPAVEMSVQETRSQLEGLAEQVQTLLADTDKLKKFKLSGYLQVRWEHSEAQFDTVGVRASGSGYTVSTSNAERFFIRRGRLKLTYDSSPWSQAVLYLDGGTDRTVRLLEAYVTLMDPWTVLHDHQLTVGQMNVPFGYELERSSSVRELPERSRAENVLFAGERDRGVKLVDRWGTKLETVLGLFNGGGINHPDFPNTDPSKDKDLLARARWSEGWLDGAVSWYRGRNVVPLSTGDVATDKTRLGFDVQYYYELPVVGGGSLRGEWYQGDEVNPDSVTGLVRIVGAVRELKPGADPTHLATDIRGGYVMWVQNLGERVQLAARYDAYDPNDDLDHDQLERWGLGVNLYPDGFTRVTAAYDVPRTDRRSGSAFADPKDNLWTVQFQHKF